MEIKKTDDARRIVRWLLIEKMIETGPQAYDIVERAKHYEAYIFGDGAEPTTSSRSVVRRLTAQKKAK